jgi:two-component system, OmpR family, KDP operon response regulator KdpE
MRLLVIDDDHLVREVVAAAAEFLWRDTEVLLAEDGARGLALLAARAPDLVLLDLGLTGMSGHDVLAAIRRASDVPVVMLTARAGELDQVRALQQGADGYVTKPFSPLALFARLRAVLRRARAAPAARAAPDVVAGPLAVDLRAGRAWVDGREVALTRAEWALLAALAEARGRVLTQAALVERVWGAEARAGAGNLKVLVNRLRAKLGPDAAAAGLIEAVRGVGYRLVLPGARPGARSA